MMGRVNSALWIVIAVVAALAVIAVVAGAVLYRRRQISFTPSQDAEVEERKPKPGGYTTSSGFDFSEGSGGVAAPERPREPEPAPRPDREAPATPDEGGASAPPEVPAESEAPPKATAGG